VGYRVKRDPLKLDFSGTEHEGLEVTVRRVPTSVMLDIVEGAQNPTALRQTYAAFTFALEGWNVEDDDGQAIPADLDGLLSQDAMFVFDVIQAWFAGMVRKPEA
jgi:hypothetical protein